MCFFQLSVADREKAFGAERMNLTAKVSGRCCFFGRMSSGCGPSGILILTVSPVP
jgi:hypothetical protein